MVHFGELTSTRTLIVCVFQILDSVLAYLTPPVFWALRGGGAGSWGVIVNATFRTFPTFEATRSTVTFTAANSTVVGALGEAYANHVFDWDSMAVGQYFYMLASGVGATYTAAVSSYIPRASTEQAIDALAPLFSDFLKAGAELASNTTTTTTINTLLARSDDQVGGYLVLGSRLIPAESYKSPKNIGRVYKQLIDVGSIGYGHRSALFIARRLRIGSS